MSINAHAPSSNDASIVLKLTYGTIDILFAADISSDVEKIMINNPSLNLDVEILNSLIMGASTMRRTSS